MADPLICEALADVQGEKHIIVDPYQRGVASIDFVAGPGHAERVGFDGLGLLNLERAGYSALIEFHGEPSFRALPALERAGQRLDFAFIDGWHTFDYALIDFFYIDRMLRAGGIVVLDDTHYPAVRTLARYIVTNRRYATVDSGEQTAPSLRRRVFDGATSVLRMPGMPRGVDRVVRPDVLEPDASIGLSPGNFVALQKTADDLLGDGAGESRR